MVSQGVIYQSEVIEFCVCKTLKPSVAIWQLALPFSMVLVIGPTNWFTVQFDRPRVIVLLCYVPMAVFMKCTELGMPIDVLSW